MKKVLLGLSLMLMMVFVLVGCDNQGDAEDNDVEDMLIENDKVEDDETDAGEDALTIDSDPINVLVTFSVIADMVENVGGDLVNVTTIVPIGQDPHEHEVTPQDVIDATDADIIFYNGLYLEVEYDWFEELMETAGREEGVDFFAVTDGIDYYTLRTEGMEDYYDPHAWMDPLRGMEYVNNITEFLSTVLPEEADVFAANAEAFNAEINEIYTEWNGRFDDIPEGRNLIVTAEGAFRYLGDRFGINNEYLWEINSEDEGTPEQFIRLIDIINASDVPYLFLESSIDPDYMEQVSEETGVPIFDDYLYTDSLSEEDGPAATYLAFLRHNLETLYTAFTGE